MALRVVLGAVLASAVMFIWGAVFWMLLPNQFAVTRSLPTEKQIAVTEVLKTQLTADGAYWLPSPDEAQDRADNPNSPFMQRHRQGPVVQIMYHMSGIEPMSPAVLGMGFMHNLVCNLFVAVLIVWLRATLCCFGSRATFAVSLGLFSGLWVEVRQVIWMHYPLDYQLFCVAYDVSTWLLGGLVLAAIVRTKKDELAQLSCPKT